MFMSLALAQPAGAVLPMQAKGHVDTMPVYGAAEDKVCTFFIGKYPFTQRAGDWATFNPGATAQNVVMVMGNDCKRRMMTINPVDLQLTEMRSHQEVLGFHPPKVPNAVPAPAKWWEKPNLLPAKPQGEVQVSGPPAGGPRVCTVKIGTTQVIQAPPIVLIIPDATRAFYLTTRRDPSIKGERISANESVDYGEEGKPVCTLEPLITLPTGTSTMAMTGGGLRTPGRITPPAKPVEPAAVALPAVIAGATGLVVGIGILHEYWLQNREALTAGGAIIYNSGADLLVATKEALVEQKAGGLYASPKTRHCHVPLLLQRTRRLSGRGRNGTKRLLGTVCFPSTRPENCHRTFPRQTMTGGGLRSPHRT